MSWKSCVNDQIIFPVLQYHEVSIFFGVNREVAAAVFVSTFYLHLPFTTYERYISDIREKIMKRLGVSWP